MPKLHIEQSGNETMRCQLQGDKILVTNMVAAAMVQNEQIAVAITTAFSVFCVETGVTAAAICNIVDRYRKKG